MLYSKLVIFHFLVINSESLALLNKSDIFSCSIIYIIMTCLMNLKKNLSCLLAIKNIVAPSSPSNIPVKFIC